MKRGGREGRHSLGIAGSQAEKNNSTFWLFWTLDKCLNRPAGQLKLRNEGSSERGKTPKEAVQRL